MHSHHPTPPLRPTRSRASSVRSGRDSESIHTANQDPASLHQLERQEFYSAFARIADLPAAEDGVQLRLSGRQFLRVLTSRGLLRDDPRLADVFSALDEHGGRGATLTFQDFREVTAPSQKLIRRALRGDLVSADFEAFSGTVQGIFDDVKRHVKGGKNADYIPQLARVNPNYWAVSVCTVDGQQLHCGDSKTPFCIQSCSKPISYGLAIDQWGAPRVHHHVGREPSGHSFNQLKLMKRPPKPVKRNPDGSVDPHGVVLLPRRSPGRRRALEHPTTGASLLQQAHAARQAGAAEVSPSPMLGSLTGTSTAHLAMATQGQSPDGHPTRPRLGAPPADGVQNGAAAEAEDDPADDSGGARIPHNACINAGAIVCCSLLRPQDSLSERVEYVVDAWERLCGSAVSIDSSLFLSERATADRNFALAYLLREMGAFPRGADNLNDTLELYFQQCSIQMCTRQMARVAAALANGGLNPLTSERVFDPLTVQYMLSQMAVAGYERRGPRRWNPLLTPPPLGPMGDRRMYDYSGMWAFKVGVPAKSGVGGCIFAIVPGFGGIVAWSPPLDSYGNSVRAVSFFERLAQTFTLHYFSNLNGIEELCHRVRLQSNEDRELSPSQQLRMLFAAAKGNIRSMKRLMAAGVGVNIQNHNLRTPLHLAASEAQLKAIRFLVSRGADVNARDRWNHTPYSDALHGGHKEAARLIKSLGGVPTWHGAWRRARLQWHVVFMLCRKGSRPAPSA